ncbi:MAG: glutathione peroxidase [Shewanellaceae bacterium]|nr:glutathione peroxidase [Shewanellaceae bacterium]
MLKSIYDIAVQSTDGTTYMLSRYQQQWMLIVNTASQCGLTPQLEELEQFYRQYQTHGLVVLGFPCDQFGSQAPGSAWEQQQFCQMAYGVTFPMHQKIHVNGSQAHPLYRWLKSAAKGWLGTRSIKWNFTKFLVNPEGQVVQRLGPHQSIRTWSPYFEGFV